MTASPVRIKKKVKESFFEIIQIISFFLFGWDCGVACCCVLPLA
jgi:hypothetical protein